MKKLWILSLPVIVLAFGLILAGCSDGSSGISYDEEFNVTAADFDTVFKSIREIPGNYRITLSGDLLDYPGVGMQTAGVNITVRGTGSNRITWKYEEIEALFKVEAGKLTLEKINLSDAEGNTQDWSSILLLAGGTIEMKNGVTISNSKGNGVYLNSNSTFIMSGGIIRNIRGGVGLGSESSNSKVHITGGEISGVEGNRGVGVNIEGSGNEVTMSGGKISTNSRVGLRFAIDSTGCTITITGGEISNNDFGVALEGTNNTATISGGRITRNVYRGVVVDGNGNTVNLKAGVSTGNGEPDGIDDEAIDGVINEI